VALCTFIDPVAAGLSDQVLEMENAGPIFDKISSALYIVFGFGCGIPIEIVAPQAHSSPSNPAFLPLPRDLLMGRFGPLAGEQGYWSSHCERIPRFGG